MSGGSSRSKACSIYVRRNSVTATSLWLDVSRGRISVVSSLWLRGFGLFGDSSSNGWSSRDFGEGGSRPARVGSVWCSALRDLQVMHAGPSGWWQHRHDAGDHLDVRRLSRTVSNGTRTVAVLFGELRWTPAPCGCDSTLRRHLASALDALGCSRDGRARGSRVPAATSEPSIQAKLIKLGTPGHERKAALPSFTEHPVISRGNLRGCRRIQPIGY